MTQEQKQSWEERFDEQFSHIRIGKKMVLFSEAYPFTFSELKQFIQQEIDLAIAEERGRIMSKIVKEVDMTDEQLQDILEITKE